jgi:osmoprotectant transport system permease protein
VGSGAEDNVMLANTFVDAFLFIGDHPHLLLTKVVEHLELSGAAIGVAIAIAIPVGVTLGHLHRGSLFAVNVSNIGRALPSLVVIAIFGLAFFGFGFVTVMIALVVLAVPPMLTNAYVAVDGVDIDAVEAARGMGMRGAQVLTRVELPLALPILFAGIRTSAVYVVATAPIAAIAGGGGLGDIIVNQASFRLAGVIGASYVVTLLALAVYGLVAACQWALTPKAFRRGNALLTSDVVTGVVARGQ